MQHRLIKMSEAFLHHFWLISNRCCTKNLNENLGLRLFWIILYLIATSGISQVLAYSIRSSTEYSSSKQLWFAQL